MIKNKKSIELPLIKSWLASNSDVNENKEIHDWITNQNDEVNVKINKKNISSSSFWFYSNDFGGIKNNSNSFFAIRGIATNTAKDPENINFEQPIIIQDEIGFLGMLCKEIDGIIYFLMQAKIEPGNINKVQLSPTIQATKSNFLQVHGGDKPLYYDYFIKSNTHNVIVDQIQSEQSSRFFKKRNRNVIINVGEKDIEISKSHRWMTLGQIKEFMTYDNLVNMDTRTVISCIPFSDFVIDKQTINYLQKNSKNLELINSIFNKYDSSSFNEIYNYINDYKMFNNFKYLFKDLYSLNNWALVNNEFVYNEYWPFKIIFCDIEIKNREVKKWDQPLFEANGIATFGIISYNDNGIKKFIVKATPEIGCFDCIEIGPTVMLEDENNKKLNSIENFFINKLSENKGVVFDTLLSEEGGRFYHEQNRNVIIEINKLELPSITKEYFAIDLNLLNNLIKFNNVINIQLRNLISLLKL